MPSPVILVTGAGSGLGAAIAERLTASGATVIVNDLTLEAAAPSAARIDADTAAFDVANPLAATKAIDEIVARHGRLDGLVNNAGIAPDRPDVTERSMANMAARLSGGEPVPTAACSELGDEAWDRMLRVHLYGTFHCTRAVLTYMKKATPRRLADGRGQSRGAIVNLASIAGLGGLATAPHYSAAKGGIIAFTRAVGAEVAPLGIRVNAVAPAFIDTPLLSWMDDLLRGYLVSRTGAGRMGRAEEVADFVCWLLSDAASYCFGEVVTMTGAFS